MLVVHPHFHHRHTGVTTHTAAIIPALASHAEVKWTGRLMPEDLARTGLREVLRRARLEPVIWHAHRNNELLLGLLLRLIRPLLRVVFTRHGSYPPSAYTRMLARRADEMITLNGENAGWMQAPSTVVPHGVDLRRFKPPSSSRGEAWARLNLGGQHGVGVVGRIRENKGQQDFVDAVAGLLPQAPSWRAVLVGRGEKSWLEGLSAKANGALLLPGEQPDIVPWYQGLSVLVNPSHGESFGLTLIEGMAAGCCVVSTRLFHTPGLIEHGRTGFLYEPRDVKGLREVLALLMREPDRAAKVGAAAAEEASSRFGIEREAAAIAAIYERVAVRSPTPRER
jgi:mannosyltransferase